ncbi:MAG: M1 family metallopeptidase [Bacteroidetes bacterium]|nr:M1 family peptidase [Bacteroidota bacterium]MBV6460971.1 hypothetical protein [Flavobacteriales bacterium]WKZ75630.1 MAG: M1 family metallopeptidase [Vicingaceae bacterium]MCL4815196.1 M1 family metallopeptidase [Flavobacteriales bacterium]NOG94538.1 M1 family metallopeptidase [Bacteroidota bacterium]
MKNVFSYLAFLSLFFVTPFLLAQEKEYFQQEVNYQIQVELDDIRHELKGVETIEYINHSPDALSYIYFHLWPNAYKNNATALCKQLTDNGETALYFSKDDERGYIDELDFKINGEKLQWEFSEEHIDICIVYLKEPLLQGEKIKITTPFHVKIPKGIYSRLGHMGQSYQITQWYPKPAVYDRQGWHPMPYLDQGEFYSEYGTYDVQITLPANYVVGATGDLINGETEIQWLNEKAIATASTNIFNSKDMSFPPSVRETKMLHYHQKNVHDFAWFADKRFHVLKGEVKLPHSGNTVTTWAMFTNQEAHLWMKSLEYLHDAVYYYSLWNGDYPYQQVTAVDGSLSAGAGMEYPNITVIGKSGSAFSLETVIMHEVGHNWFYGILGSNERYHPWMDEGINSLNELRYIETKYPNASLLGNDSSSPFLKKLFDLDYTHKAQYYFMYLFQARRNLDQAIEEKSQNYTHFNYAAIVYSKTAAAFWQLKTYLGDAVFDQCMQTYFERWKFKHPYPKDLQNVFEEISGKNLSWFFNDLLTTTYKIDYKIGRIKKHDEDSSLFLVKIKNRGKISTPFSISAINKEHIYTTVTFESIAKKEFVPFPKGNYKQLRIDAEENMLEFSRKNNTIRTKGLFKKTEPIRLQWLGSIDNGHKNQLYYTPLVAWNKHNGFMAGIALYNNAILQKKTEYVLAPLWAFGSQTPTGFASAAYTIFPNALFRTVRLAVNARSFSHYTFNSTPLNYFKWAPEADITFKKQDARNKNTIHLLIRHVNVTEEMLDIPFIDAQGTLINIFKTNYYYINELRFTLQNSDAINPFHASVNIQQNENMLKTNLEANYFFRYKESKSKGFNIRFFVGRFLYNNNTNTRFNYTFSQRPDYMYDDLYLGRNANGFFSQQFTLYEGGFKNLIPLAPFNRWLNAINLSTTLPKIPVALYADAGIAGFEYADRSGNLIDDATELVYCLGITYQVFPSFCEIYFPVLISPTANQLKYSEKIRFTLNLTHLNPFKTLRKIEL